MSKIVIKTIAKAGLLCSDVVITAKVSSDKLVRPLKRTCADNTLYEHKRLAKYLAHDLLQDACQYYEHQSFCWTSNEYIHIFTRKTDATTTTDNGA